MPLRVEFVPVEAPLGNVAIILRVADASDALRWRQTWRSSLRRAGADDAQWDWLAYIERAHAVDGFLCIAAVSGDDLEGLLSLSIAPSRLEAGKQVVYVEYIASAPWNRRELVDAPKVRGLGRVLVQTAMSVAMDLGHDGRVGLHSKPNVERFYREKLGFHDLGREVAEDGEWVYFEATPEVARRLLQ